MSLANKLVSELSALKAGRGFELLHMKFSKKASDTLKEESGNGSTFFMCKGRLEKYVQEFEGKPCYIDPYESENKVVIFYKMLPIAINSKVVKYP